ncbi:MAG: TolC family protein [Desulfobulbaceae bacterium]|nr:TolC family protein [Desulfobulbaceae bacterium]
MMRRFFGAITASLLALVMNGCLGVTLNSPTTRPVDLSTPEQPRPPGPDVAPVPVPTGTSPEVAEYYYRMTEKPSSLESMTADTPLELSVEQAVVSALENNRALVVEQFNHLIAGTFVDTERGVFDPTLFAEATLETYRQRSFNEVEGRLFSLDGDERTIVGGISQQLPTGTELSLEIAQQGGTRDDIRANDEARAGLNLTQALLRGGNLAANLAGIHRAQAAALASAYELRGFTENLVARVENAYWDYALATRQVEIFEESFALAQRQRDDIHTRIEVGQIAETEEVVANAELALRRQQLIDARNDREQARLSLLRLINPPSARGWDQDIRLSEKAVIPEVRLGSAEEHERLATRLRPDLNEARLQARRGELETVQTANGLLPRLDLFITLGKTGYARSFGESFTDLDGPGYNVSAGLAFELPVGNRAAKALDRRARAGYRQALHSIDNLQQLISLEVRTALLEVERSLQQIDASAARRILQEEVQRAETVRFRVGTATALDVARVQRDLLESRINEVEAIVNYRQALINLYLLDGTLLLRRGIDGPGAEEVLF